MVIDLILLDSKSMIGILTWINIALAVLVLAYRFTRTEMIEKRVISLFAFAKLFQGMAWYMLFVREYIHLFWSRFVGNNILFIGFALESMVMLAMIKKLKKVSLAVQVAILFVGCIMFNTIPGGTPDYVYVIIASLVTFFIFLYPVILYMISNEGSNFKRFLGLGYVFFLLTLVLRAGFAYIDVEMNLFTVNYIQHISFITLILLTVVSGPGFLLMLKEEADNELRVLASLDELTRISNRRHFLKEAQLIYDDHKKNAKQVAILFIDIDNFKQVNDEYGHDFGDEVLQSLANVLKSVVRGEDLVCRYGGEEFLVMLQETHITGAETVIDHIRSHIRKSPLSRQHFKYTISVGLHAGIPSHHTLYEFIKRSDQAMYQAKQTGKNRYVIYEE